MKEITVSQYAARHRMSRQGVLKRIKRGALRARKVGHYWLISTL